MISGMTEEGIELANARLDVLMKCGENTLKIIDNDYENEIVRLQQETERLYNIINELEKYLTNNYESLLGMKEEANVYCKLVNKDILDKLKELKEKV